MGTPKIYIETHSDRIEETKELVMKTYGKIYKSINDYIPRIRNILSPTDEIYMFRCLMGITNRFFEEDETNVVTNFIRGKLSYLEKDKQKLCVHPAIYSIWHLSYLLKMFERIKNSRKKEIYTFTFIRHGEKDKETGKLNDTGKKQAMILGKILGKQAEQLKEKNKNLRKRSIKLGNHSNKIKNSGNDQLTYREPIYIFTHKIVFESIATTLFFGNRYQINLKNIQNNRNYKSFPHNDSTNRLKKSYLHKDRTKTLENAEYAQLIFYPETKGQEAYMEINWRGIKERITYKKFNEIVDNLNSLIHNNNGS